MLFRSTGNLHLGNYLGAIVNFVEMQKTHNCIYCVVDLHALTQPPAVWGGPEGLTKNIREVTAAFLAAGAVPVRLGPWVLRVETAAIAALALVSAELARPA